MPDPDIISQDEASALRKGGSKQTRRQNFAYGLGGSFDVLTFKEGAEGARIVVSVPDVAALTEAQRADIARALRIERERLAARTPATAPTIAPAPPAPVDSSTEAAASGQGRRAELGEPSTHPAAPTTPAPAPAPAPTSAPAPAPTPAPAP